MDEAIPEPAGVVERQRSPLPLQLIETCRRASKWMRIVGLFTLIGSSLLCIMFLGVGTVAAIAVTATEMPESTMAIVPLFAAGVTMVPAVVTGVLLLRASGVLEVVANHPERGHPTLVSALEGLIPLFVISILTAVFGLIMGVFV